jgi:hypothetical protein
MQIPPRQCQHRPPVPDSAEARRYAQETRPTHKGAQACRAVEQPTGGPRSSLRRMFGCVTGRPPPHAGAAAIPSRAVNGSIDRLTVRSDLACAGRTLLAIVFAGPDGRRAEQPDRGALAQADEDAVWRIPGLTCAAEWSVHPRMPARWSVGFPRWAGKGGCTERGRVLWAEVIGSPPRRMQVGQLSDSSLAPIFTSR